MVFDWTQGELAEGLRCYRAEKFFEAHEHWESVWLQLHGAERIFLQGVILLTVSLYQYRRGNQQGAISQMKNSLRKLEASQPGDYGLDVASLCSELRPWIALVEAGEPIQNRVFPSLRLQA